LAEVVIEIKIGIGDRARHAHLGLLVEVGGLAWAILYTGIGQFSSLVLLSILGDRVRRNQVASVRRCHVCCNHTRIRKPTKVLAR